MTQILSTEVMVSGTQSKPASAKAKRIAQMAGAAALSIGMVGTFSLPAYATGPTTTEGTPDGFAMSQTLDTVEADDAVLPLTAPDGAVDSAILEQERQAEEAEEAAAKAAEEAAKAAESSESAATAPAPAGFSGQDVPAGAGASGIVAAAYAQLGQMQDCTALVERSLQAIGVPAGDLGTQIGEYTGLGGVQVTDGAYAPGDILIWSGRHVAVYVGNGQAVHGGFGGNQTVVASAFLDGAPNGVVRFG